MPLVEPIQNGSSIRSDPTAIGIGTTLLIAIWFGMVSGLLEGLGLLLFQRVNWASWGPMLHVSAPILWISPLVDIGLFVGLAALTFVILRGLTSIRARWRESKFSPLKISSAAAVLFVLVFATIYDWLTLTGRLYHKSSLLLAAGVAVVFSRWVQKRQDRAIAFWRRSLPVLCMICLLTLLGIEGSQRWRENHALAQLTVADANLPNIIVIVVDTLRADHLSAYGYSRRTSPNIDRLSREGVLFENAISTSSWSLPSHASLVTGRYVHEHGEDNVKPIPVFGPNQNNFAQLPTIGEQLQALGYRTAAFSANRTWFSHDLGFDRGFMHFEDYFHSPADMLVRTLYGREFARIYLSRTDHSKPKRFLRWIGWDSLLDPDEEGSGSRGGALGVRKRAWAVNRELENWIAGDSSHHPFFAFLNYFDVHKQYGGPRGYSTPEWPQQDPADKYDDSIRYVDDNIGELLSTLHGRDSDTLLIVTSDHGESLGEHGLETHGGSLYWNLIHVPLIVWWPGHVPPGVRVVQPITNAVIPATLMALIGKTPPDSFRGPALDALLKLNPGTSQVFSQLSVSPYSANKDRPPDPVPTAATGPMFSIVSGNLQLIQHAKYGNQLYDWARDPGETNDLSITPAGKAELLPLLDELQGAIRRSPTSPKSLTDR